jgi:hypothetical protein
MRGDGGEPCGFGVGYQTNLAGPDILIVMSRALELGSGLNQACMIPECTQWGILEPAVNDVAAANPDDNYGLMMFGASGNCVVPENPDLPVSLRNWMQVIYETGIVSLGGTSPMAGTITSAVTYLQSLTDVSRKYVLLVTDGEATCPPGDANGTMDDTTRAVGEIQAAAAAGFPTLVLGVADSNNAQAVATLNAMANAGLLPQVGANTAYYDANASSGIAALNQAIAALVGETPNCTIAVPDGQPSGSALSVTIDHGYETTLVPYDPTGASGWNYTDSTHNLVILSGAYCNQLGIVGQTTVELTFNCSLDAGALPIP